MYYTSANVHWVFLCIASIFFIFTEVKFIKTVFKTQGLPIRYIVVISLLIYSQKCKQTYVMMLFRPNPCSEGSSFQHSLLSCDHTLLTQPYVEFPCKPKHNHDKFLVWPKWNSNRTGSLRIFLYVQTEHLTSWKWSAFLNPNCLLLFFLYLA